MSDNTALPASLGGVSKDDLLRKDVLFLKGRCISDNDCKVLAPILGQNLALQQLYIGYNDFGDEGTMLLCEAFCQDGSGNSLKLLGLRHCHVGDDGAKAVANLLARSTSIREVGLDENSIGDDGIKAIAQALAENTNTILQDLYVGENVFSKEAADVLHKVAVQRPGLRVHLRR
eukprot:gnl/TRDRNA2_/TRDRNA2_172924_c0_seq2.p1 gnl/TRDRNA2_/TRDRNA2_172924_c0~~gnl/TRDRNA2_/TRDRNA2_172924_c0_seq2.p1  ORF type:complete len:174 (-),score=35.74 gnl/TRDRNA2_/TRDRNA2_172924_c0_seq2:149-670(-)